MSARRRDETMGGASAFALDLLCFKFKFALSTQYLTCFAFKLPCFDRICRCQGFHREDHDFKGGGGGDTERGVYMVS